VDSNKKIILRKSTFFLFLTICLLSYLTFNFSQTANAQTTTNSYTVGGTLAASDFIKTIRLFPKQIYLILALPVIFTINYPIIIGIIMKLETVTLIDVLF